MARSSCVGTLKMEARLQSKSLISKELHNSASIEMFSERKIFFLNYKTSLSSNCIAQSR